MAHFTDGTAHRETLSGIDEALSKIREAFEGKEEALIPMLQKVQKTVGYLPERALLEIARWTGLPPATVFGVATFYEQFRFHPMGKHAIRVCRGTACHVKGSDRILNDIENVFKVAPGDTSEDRSFTLETVACFGSCALAPVLLVDDSVKGRMNPSKTRKIIEQLRDETVEASTDRSDTEQGQ